MAFPSTNKIPPKDPLDALTYAFDWSNFWPPGATIVSATITVPTGVTLVSPAVINGMIVNFMLSGAIANNSYEISCLARTDIAGTANRSFQLNVKNL